MVENNVMVKFFFQSVPVHVSLKMLYTDKKKTIKQKYTGWHQTRTMIKWQKTKHNKQKKWTRLQRLRLYRKLRPTKTKT